MRKEEEQAKGYFNGFLEARYSPRDILWEDGDEPPDYWLTLSGARYAVEVTSILERANIGTSVTSHLTVWKAIRDFVETIEEEALKEGILNGSYHVGFKPVNNLKSAKAGIRKSIKDFVHKTKDVNETDSHSLPVDGSCFWTIKKTGGNNDHLYIGTTETRWGEDIEGLVFLADQAIENKINKLKHIRCDKVLILLVAYPWVKTSTWESLVNIELITKFHTIMAVNLMFEKAYSVIFSQYQPWNKVQDRL